MTRASRQLLRTFCLGLLLFAGALRAAITFDNVSSSFAATPSTTHSFSHTISSGSNRLLVVLVATEDANAADAVISGATYNGVAMTLVPSSRSTLTGTGTNESAIFYLLNASLPAAGTYTVQITTAGTSEIIGTAISLFGVRQQAAEAVATNTSTVNTVSTNITTVTNGAWVIDVLSNGGANNQAFTTTTTGMVERSDLAGGGHSSATSTKPTTTAGSTTMSWSHSQFGREAHSVAAFAEMPTLTGTVFEDVNYAGGVGRSLATSSGSPRSGARVELYSAAGAYISATTTDGSGNYSFTVSASTSYTVRVVNSTVTSSLGGTSLIPVQTFRTTATTGSAVAVTDRVGGENPGLADAGNGSTTLGALTAGSLTPQSITSVTVGSNSIENLDFGFNFSTIVNNNDTGQGSLRQFITNANGMTGTQSSVFMITDGAAHAGLRSGLTSDLTSGVAVITLASALPQITDTITLDATTQTTNIGNTNAGTLGTGGTVGVDAVSLSTVNRPEVEIISGQTSTLSIAAANSTVKGFGLRGALNSNNNHEIGIVGASGVTITQNVIGTTTTSFTLPASGRAEGCGIHISGTVTSGTISNNLIGFTRYHGIALQATSSGVLISLNEISGCGRNAGNMGGIDLLGSSHTISSNLLTGNKGQAIDNWTAGNNSQTIVNNTITGNGVSTTGTRETSGIRLRGSNSTVDRNIVASNYGAGILVNSSGTGNRLTRNSIYSNGTITNDSAEAASGQVGIDLQSASDDASGGTAPYYTINDNADSDSGGNNLLNAPVIESASISGSNLVVQGWARPGSIIELFISDSDASGFGEGQTYLTTLTEGGGSDTDATSTTYTNPVNSLNQGTDTTNRFTFTFAKPGSVSNGTKLTATATDGSNNTSEFSGQVTVATPSLTLSGNVFEDTSYAGGSGRDKTTASGTNRAGARVELYDASGNYVTATTTDASGNYSFASLAGPATYTVRVVNSTVTSSLGGGGLLPVQTYRTTATTGSAVAVTDRVGGEDPTKADAGNGSTTLAALTTGSLTPQSITTVNAGTSSVTGIDFGFNFATIVNTADTGQGSLRQFITNANAMTGTQTTVFMISDGSAHAGLRAGLTNQLTSGVAVITPVTALPTFFTTALVIDGTSQTTNVGDTNAGTLGTGGTVGVDGVALSTVNRPEVEIVGNSSLSRGLEIQVAGCTIKGIAIHGFGSSAFNGDIYIGAPSGQTVTQNVIGTSATSFSLPAAASGGAGIYTDATTGGSFTNNVIGFLAYEGIYINNNSAGTCTIQNNEIRGCGRSSSGAGAIALLGTGHTVSSNLIVDSKGQGIDAYNTTGGSNTFVNNTITGNGIGNASATETTGLRLNNGGNTIDRNRIYANYGAGVLIGSSATTNKITQNSIYSNGTILSGAGAAATGNVGIDLQASGNNNSLGTAPYYTINDSGDGDAGGNNLLNFPVLDRAYITGGNLVLTGWAPAGAIIEFFVSDNATAGFGQGQTYVTAFTEGSGSDTDATSTAYTNPVNGLNQGGETTNRFAFTIATPGSVSNGVKLTATARDVSNNTSEFSGQVTVGSVSLSGNVFEDVTYAGGVGRDKATSSGSGRSGARVEIFDASGNYLSAATTDVNGDYTIADLAINSSYTVRVVNSTVTSSLGGTSLLPVQTYRTTATTGSAVAVTDRVGGEDPTKADAGNGSTTLAALTAGSLTPQSITSVTTATGNITGLDFGFNFNTVVNTANSGQGSLRQLITNANGMTGTQTSAFMISDGSAHAGLRAGLTNQLTSGVAIITPATTLPQITGAIVLDATTQTTNVGDTNTGTLGTGGTVGVGAVALSPVNRPEVEIVGSSSVAYGFDIAAASTTIKGFSVHGFGNNGLRGDIHVGAYTGITITQNVIGATASSFSLPAAPTGGNGIRCEASSGGTISNNLIGFTAYEGASTVTGATAWTIQGNEVRGCGTADASSGGISVGGASSSVTENLVAANKGRGIKTDADSCTYTNNTITGNGVGTAGTPITPGFRIRTSNNTATLNIISNNYGAGIMVTSTGTGNRLSQNSIYGNGTILNDDSAAATGNIGIDLQAAGDSASTGTAPYYTLNDDGDGDSGGNALRNYPVLDSATIVGTNLEITGWSPTGATIELFISDNDPSGFGEGQTYIGSVVEGGGSDTDATTSSYSGNVNCFAQGTGTNVNRFKYTFALPGGITAGTTKITSTAYSGGNTSEFSGQVTVYTAFPSFAIVKASQTYSDPFNATTNPKSVPGSFILYSCVTTNSYPARSDTDTFNITDAIPTNTELYVGDLGGAGSGPVSFTDGATSSALTYTFTSLSSTTDDVEFSNDNGATYAYSPSPDSNGCDANVTHIRIKPKGAFAKSACGNNPSCTIAFRVRVK
jgi:parallel beta-helix repeat protein